jgi:hypothetical protein
MEMDGRRKAQVGDGNVTKHPEDLDGACLERIRRQKPAQFL